ncbi:uncharacterized protein Dana_GF26937 [Drosophila ananassae]|uniref:Uncharacterized protein n=1 Tax=Drosophila ananassae TaxID=7217 RepID=A0A0P8Y6T2_DROAN|nr:uncharacterized protein Dana_GF26937 [Drosophila ananassae]
MATPNSRPPSTDHQEKPQWQVASPPRKRAPPRKKTNASAIELTSSDSEPGELKKKPAKKRNINKSPDKPSTSAAARARMEKINKTTNLEKNYFAALSTDDDSDSEDDGITDSDMEVDGMKKKVDKKTKRAAEKTAKIIKPPPIFIPDVSSIKGLSKDISRVLGEDVEVTYKASANNTIRVMTSTPN